MNTLDLAQSRWRAELWGEPADAEQERLWTLFFTGLPPGMPMANTPGAWDWRRPPVWVEDLIRERRAVVREDTTPHEKSD